MLGNKPLYINAVYSGERLLMTRTMPGIEKYSKFTKEVILGSDCPITGITLYRHYNGDVCGVEISTESTKQHTGYKSYNYRSYPDRSPDRSPDSYMIGLTVLDSLDLFTKPVFTKIKTRYDVCMELYESVQKIERTLIERTMDNYPLLISMFFCFFVLYSLIPWGPV